MSEDEPVFTRKHKALLRRAGSFKRMQSLPQRVDHWFHSDSELHSSWDRFAAAHRESSPVFSPSPAAPLLEADHAARIIHEKFCDLFESQLTEYLAGLNVGMEEFQEAFRISKDEEQRDGECFYRWPEVVEFDVFLSLMRGGSEALLSHIDKLVEEARLDFRRRVTFFPLIIRWSPPSFTDVDEALDAAMKKAGVTHGLAKPQLKELVRWRAKLSSKTLVGGMYTDPPRDEEAWARFLAFKTSRLGPIALEGVIDALQEHAKCQNSSAENNERRELLSCFDALDSLHQGCVSMTLLTSAVLKSGVVPEKAVKKATASLLAKRRQLRADDRKSADADDNPRLTMLEAIEALENLLRPADGVDASQLLCARLQKVAETARDRM
uniref:BART domain-containing protein n=1 Tax=Neobodo designis TaxID=312471 RepID=A0A7S1R3G6_NEODS